MQSTGTFLSYTPRKQYKDVFQTIIKNSELKNQLRTWCEGLCTIVYSKLDLQVKVFPCQPEMAKKATQFNKKAIDRIEKFLDTVPVPNVVTTDKKKGKKKKEEKRTKRKNGKIINSFPDKKGNLRLCTTLSADFPSKQNRDEPCLRSGTSNGRQASISFTNVCTSSGVTIPCVKNLPMNHNNNPDHMFYTPKLVYQSVFQFVLRNEKLNKKLQSWCEGICTVCGYFAPVKVVALHPDNFKCHSQFSKKAIELIESFLDTVLKSHIHDNKEGNWFSCGNKKKPVSFHHEGKPNTSNKDDKDNRIALNESSNSYKVNKVGTIRKNTVKYKAAESMKKECTDAKLLHQELTNEANSWPSFMLYTPKKAHKSLLGSVITNDCLYKELLNYCKGYCTIECCSFPLHVIPLDQKKFVNYSQFTKIVVALIESFLDIIFKVFIPFDEESISILDEYKNVWFSNVLNGADSVVLSFKPNGLEICGMPEAVEKYKKLVEEKLTVATKEITCPIEVSRALVNCGVIDEVNKALQGKSKVTCSINECIVTFTGRTCYMEYAFDQLATKGVFVEEAPALSVEKLAILTQLLSGDGNTSIESFVNKQLQDNKIKAVLVFRNDDITLTAMTRDVFDTASKFIGDLIQSAEVVLPIATPENLIEDDYWKSLIATVESKQISIKFKGQSIEVAGIDGKVVSQTLDRIKNHLKQFARLDGVFLYFKPCIVRYIFKHCYQDNINIPRNIIIKEAAEGLQLHGTQIERVVEYLRGITWQRASLSYSCPNLASHFASDTWKGFLNLLESEVKCSISYKKNSWKSTQKEIQGTSSCKEYKTAKYGSITVSVCLGDITEDNSDVIINEITGDFNLSKGALSSSLLLKSGQNMQHQCTSSPVMSSSGIRVTNGWNLLCDYVIHFVTPYDGDQLKSLLKDALDHVETLEKESVSLPALGEGHIGFACDDVASVLCKAFELFSSEKPKFVKSIKVVVNDRHVFDSFHSAIIEKKKIMSFGKKKAHAAEKEAKLSLVGDHVTIHIVSEEAANLSEAIQRTQAHMEERIERKVLKDDLISELDDHDCIDIYQAAVKHQVSITFNTIAFKLILNGLSKNVSKLYDVIRELLFELRESMTMRRLFDWKWASSSQQFTSLPLRVGRAIELTYEKNKSGASYVGMYGSTLDLDFATMTYTFNEITGKLKRIDISAEKISSRSGEVTKEALYNAPQTPCASEYGRAATPFESRSPTHNKMISIERIQHPSPCKQYLIKKSDVERHMISKHTLEREMFRGTSESDADKVCSEGFDRNFAGKYGIQKRKLRVDIVSSPWKRKRENISASTLL